MDLDTISVSSLHVVGAQMKTNRTQYYMHALTKRKRRPKSLGLVNCGNTFPAKRTGNRKVLD